MSKTQDQIDWMSSLSLFANWGLGLAGIIAPIEPKPADLGWPEPVKLIAMDQTP